MKRNLLIFLIFTLTHCEGLKNYIGTDFEKCINCLCDPNKCAKSSITFDYWKVANSPRIEKNDDPESMLSYNKCMKDENCILATIAQYAEAFGYKDCFNDDIFDCRDVLAIHLYGLYCFHSGYGQIPWLPRLDSCVRDLDVVSVLF